MARTSNKTAVSTEVPVSTSSESTVSRKEFDELVAKNNKLTEMLEQLLSSKSESSVVNTGTPDTWTLVHLQECDRRLPTVFSVNGKMHYFTTFGETKKFPVSDLGNIIAQYRSYFVRGVFALGNDCEQYKYEIPSDIMMIPFPESFFKNITNLSDEDFERNISKLVPEQILQIANVWRNRFFQKKSEYRNINKIKILNKYTDGFMKPVLDKMNTD